MDNKKGACFTDFALLIISLRTFIGLIVLITFLILIVIPNRKTKLFNQLPGAIISALDGLWFSCIALFIDNFSNYNIMVA